MITSKFPPVYSMLDVLLTMQTPAVHRASVRMRSSEVL